MFTGLIEEIGVVRASRPTARGLRIQIAAATVLDDLAVGDSIAVDGVCQTVVAHDAEGFAVEVMAPTLACTTLGGLAPGARVNLERALAIGARIGGHLVQGHVDEVGRITAIERDAEHVWLAVEVSDAVADVAVPHGSIALNGVSLTIREISGHTVIRVALIPHTWEHTSLSGLEPGDAVNVEGDLIGRFVVEYLKRRGAHAI